jgi:hypothetical protein
MGNRNACKDEDLLIDRLIRVENAIFILKAKSECFPAWDNSEVERLERMRLELRESYEILCQGEEMAAV